MLNLFAYAMIRIFPEAVRNSSLKGKNFKKAECAANCGCYFFFVPIPLPPARLTPYIYGFHESSTLLNEYEIQ